MRSSRHGRRDGVRGRRGQPADPVAVVEVVDRDADGDLFVRAVRAASHDQACRLAPGGAERSGEAPGLGDRLLVRFATRDNGEREAILIKRLGQSAHHLLAAVRGEGRRFRLEPVDRRARTPLVLQADQSHNLADGDLVLVQPEIHPSRPHGPKSARLISRIGREDDPRAASLIAAHVNGLPMGFPAEAEAEARTARTVDPKGRVDLRHLPFVTIDPADARDHDDAVFAEPDGDPRNVGGWVVWVAIADVAAFVPPGSALDRTAREKGNSVYFPDRVEPMLPETLSADLCSLREGEDRASLAVRMVFDGDGRRLKHRFERALVRSAASLTYEQAQRAAEGSPDEMAAPWLDRVIRPLWGAFGVLEAARRRRAPLSIRSIERRIVLGVEGSVVSISPRLSLEAHRLIEEFMIQANVCAAVSLEERRAPLIYRVHESPTADKLTALKDFLATLDVPWSAGERVRTDRFNRLLDETHDGPHAEIVNEVVLRTQMQAVYATDNLGHFGLNLPRYAHFTSPIRRYADLIVHRALIGAFGFGEDGLSATDATRLGDTAEHITMTERRAMAAEREANERYVAAYLADRVGATLAGSVTGVTRFGLFIRLAESGADGLAPISALGADYFVHDETTHSLVGQRSGLGWRLGERVEVRLREANSLTGGLLFEVLSKPAPIPSSKKPMTPKQTVQERHLPRRARRRHG